MCIKLVFNRYSFSFLFCSYRLALQNVLRINVTLAIRPNVLILNTTSERELV